MGDRKQIVSGAAGALMSAAALLALSATGASAGTRAPFQFWTLAMSYQNEFCTTHAQNPECAGGVAQVKGLTLHGFWPSLNSGDGFGPAPKFERPAISETTINELEGVMPSARCHFDGAYAQGSFCLPDHEWEVHGAVSGMDPDHYFETATILANRFRALPAINGLLERRAGRTATADELKSALAVNLPGASTKLVCEPHADGGQWLVEIEVALDLSHYDAFPLPVSFHRPFRDYRGAPQDYCPHHGPIHIE